MLNFFHYFSYFSQLFTFIFMVFFFRLGIKKSERGLDNAKLITDSKYFGRPLGEYNGPLMNRIVCKAHEV